MSVLSKVITTVFGKKSDKDLKKLSPFVDDINNHFDSLSNITDQELKARFLDIKAQFKELEDGFKSRYKGSDFDDEYSQDLSELSQSFLYDKMVEVFA